MTPELAGVVAGVAVLLVFAALGYGAEIKRYGRGDDVQSNDDGGGDV